MDAPEEHERRAAALLAGDFNAMNDAQAERVVGRAQGHALLAISLRLGARDGAGDVPGARALVGDHSPPSVLERFVGVGFEVEVRTVPGGSWPGAELRIIGGVAADRAQCLDHQQRRDFLELADKVSDRMGFDGRGHALFRVAGSNLGLVNEAAAQLREAGHQAQTTWDMENTRPEQPEDWFVDCAGAGFHGPFDEATARAKVGQYDTVSKFYCGPHTAAQDTNRARRSTQVRSMPVAPVAPASTGGQG